MRPTSLKTSPSTRNHHWERTKSILTPPEGQLWTAALPTVPSYNMKPVFVSLASCTGDKGCLAKGSSKAQAAVVTPLLSS